MKMMKRDGFDRFGFSEIYRLRIINKLYLDFNFIEEASHFIVNNFILALIFQSNEYDVVRVRFAIIR